MIVWRSGDNFWESVLSSQGSNSGHLAWWQKPSPSEPPWLGSFESSFYFPSKYISRCLQPKERQGSFISESKQLERSPREEETRLHIQPCERVLLDCTGLQLLMHKHAFQKLCSVREDIHTGTGLTRPLFTLKTGCSQTFSAPVSVSPGLCLEALSTHSLQEMHSLWFPP